LGENEMRKIQARRAIVEVLMNNPNGITGQEIIPKLDPKLSRQSITDSRHISILLRGAKGVERVKEGEAYLDNPNSFSLHKYKVLLYKVTDEQALIDWVGGRVR